MENLEAAFPLRQWPSPWVWWGSFLGVVGCWLCTEQHRLCLSPYIVTSFPATGTNVFVFIRAGGNLYKFPVCFKFMRWKKNKRVGGVDGAHLHSGSTWEEVCKSALFSSSSVLFSKKIPSEILFRKESLSNTGNDSAFKVASTCPKSREILKIQNGSALKHWCHHTFRHRIKLARICVPNTPWLYHLH